MDEVRALRSGPPVVGIPEMQLTTLPLSRIGGTGRGPCSFPRPNKVAPEGIHLLTLCEKDDMDAMLQLANQLLDGIGGVKDRDGALAIYSYVLAKKLNGQQLFNIGGDLEKRGLVRESLLFWRKVLEVEEDKDQLREFAERLSGSPEKGEIAFAMRKKAEAWLLVARCLRNGTGIRADAVEAAKCYWEAVGKGDIEAALELGLWFGERGAMPEARQALAKCGLDVMIPWKQRLIRLYRADGNVDAAQFHAACDGKAPTLMVLMTRRGSIFGGFTPVPWESSGSWKQNPETFAFILRSPKVSEARRLTLALPQYAVFHYQAHGPHLGDIYIHNSGVPANNYISGGTIFSGVPPAERSIFDGTEDGKFEIQLLEIWQLI